MNSALFQRAERLKLSDFILLNELARLGSIREASRFFKSTPAQVSRRLKVIERVVGVRIFERGPKGLIPSAEADAILRFSILMESEFQTSVTFGRQKRANLNRPLGIGATSFLTSFAVAPALGEVLTSQPDLRTYLLAFNPDELVPAGTRGAIQLAVHPGHLDWPRSWQSEYIGRMRWSLFARKGHPIFRSKTPIEELAFVYPLMWDGGKLVVQNDNCPIPVNRRNSFVGTQTAEQAMHVVRATPMVGFLPKLLMREAVQNGEVREVEIAEWPLVEQPVHISVKTDAVSSMNYRLITEALKRVLQLG